MIDTVRHRTAFCVAGFAATVLAWAGVMKFVDLPYFGMVLESYHVVPRGMVGVLSVVVPGTEVLIGLNWLLSPRRWMWSTFGALLVVVFTAIYTEQALQGSAPACGCFGGWYAEQELFKEVRWVIGRNAAMIAAFVAHALVSRARAAPAAIAA